MASFREIHLPSSYLNLERVKISITELLIELYWFLFLALLPSSQQEDISASCTGAGHQLQSNDNHINDVMNTPEVHFDENQNESFDQQMDPLSNQIGGNDMKFFFF